MLNFVHVTMIAPTFKARLAALMVVLKFCLLAPGVIFLSLGL